MASLEETAYPQLNGDISLRELQHRFTPTADEQRFVDQQGLRSTARFAFWVQLKTFQRLGYFVLVSEVPVPIRQHIARVIDQPRPPSVAELQRYEQSGTQRRHRAILRDYLQVRALEDSDWNGLAGVARQAADTKNQLSDIINVLLEELVRQRYELPAFRALHDLAESARAQVHRAFYTQLDEALTPAAKTLIDELLQVPAGAVHSGWQLLKREPKKPTNKEVRSYLQHIQRLRHLVEQLPPLSLSIPKLKYFRTLARALNAKEVADFAPAKRYAIATVFIRAQYSKTLDDAADIFIRLINNLENNARKQLLDYQLEHTRRADELVGRLRDVLHAYQLDGTVQQRFDAIGQMLEHDAGRLLAECEEHMAYANKNYLPFLLKPYQSLRALLLNSLEIMAPRSTSRDATLEKLLPILQAMRASRQAEMTLSQLGLEAEADLGWLSGAWRKMVFVKHDGRLSTDRIVRKYLELAVLFRIKDELKSGDLYIADGEKYDDYREQLVDDATLETELRGYGEITGLSTEAGVFVRKLQQQLASLAEQVDAGFPADAHAEIVDGVLILKRHHAAEPSAELKRVDAIISERMSRHSVVDILVDCDNWLDLHQHFKPVSGNEARIEDRRLRFVTTLFCYGFNMGLEQTARSLRGFTPRQIAWLNIKHATEEVIEQATTDVINAYNRFELPRYWGTGKQASADGTKWNVYEQNLLSEFHIRYGGYGGIGYYHVSDKYIALYSHFIPCGVYEGTYILDGLLANQSDIQPDTVHGDTQAQSLPVFGLAHLLGIQLMPRIRNLKDLIFHRPEPGARYRHIQSLFGDAIDWGLIETHLQDMLRVAVSIKLGKITASSILRRLGTYSQKNKLYFAFRELGRAIRTLFLLRYISDFELRKTIHAATNKSEEYNSLVKWSFFGGGGVIQENLRHEQRKLIKYNQLVVNMIILHNVHHMTAVLAELRREGTAITPEILAGLAPYRVSHINRFGDYFLDLGRTAGPLGHEEKILH